MLHGDCWFCNNAPKRMETTTWKMRNCKPTPPHMTPGDRANDRERYIKLRVCSVQVPTPHASAMCTWHLHTSWTGPELFARRFKCPTPPHPPKLKTGLPFSKLQQNMIKTNTSPTRSEKQIPGTQIYTTRATFSSHSWHWLMLIGF